MKQIEERNHRESINKMDSPNSIIVVTRAYDGYVVGLDDTDSDQCIDQVLDIVNEVISSPVWKYTYPRNQLLMLDFLFSFLNNEDHYAGRNEAKSKTEHHTSNNTGSGLLNLILQESERHRIIVTVEYKVTVGGFVS